jgi:hypothetical protein
MRRALHSNPLSGRGRKRAPVGRSPHQRRGAAMMFTAILMTVLLGFAALAVDLGRLYYVRAELQRTADAAALAAALGLPGDGVVDGDYSPRIPYAYAGAYDVALRNKTFGDGSHLSPQDVEFGWIEEPDDLSSPFIAGTVSDFNAVRVTTHRGVGYTDGPVPLTFGRIFGKEYSSVGATAVAILDDHFAGIRPPAIGRSVLTPFSIHRDWYQQQLDSGDDLFSYEDGVVKQVSDGISELWIFPDKKADGTSSDGRTSNDGAGNFGILNVGVPSVGVPPVEDQILNGITAEAFVREWGEPEIRFVGDNGGHVTYTATGTPGMKGGVEDAVEARVGDVVGFFIHDNVVDTGSNTEFRIVDIRFGRVCEVVLSGNPDTRRIVIEPVSYAGSDIITDSWAESSGGTVASVRLAR